MKRPLLRGVLGVALLTLTAAGCSNNDTSTTPTGPSVPEITEPDFTGTLTINGGVTTNFNVTSTGTVTAIVTALEPNRNATLSVGLALGTWNSTSCQIVPGLINDNTGIGSGVAGFANAAGSLCARSYDVGQMTEPVAFVVQIKHY